MSLNQQLIAQSFVYANSEIPFVFNQTNIVTDPDRAYFPYTYWFRGEYTSDLPIIADREAGFRPRVEMQTIPVSFQTNPHSLRRQARSAYNTCYLNSSDGAVEDGSSDESDVDNINNFTTNLRGDRVRQKRYINHFSNKYSKYNLNGQPSMTPCFRGSKQQMRDCFTDGKNKYIETDPTYLDNRKIFLYR